MSDAQIHKYMNIIDSFENTMVGSLIHLHDVDLQIEMSEHEDTKGRPLDFLIKNKEWNANGEDSGYIFLTLNHVGSKVEYLLVCSYFGEGCDIKLFQKPPFFEPDRRDVLAKSENGWLFDGEGFPEEIYSGEDVFKKKFQNEVFDTVSIIEWETQSKIVNYQLLLREDNSTNQFGGWVEFYEGRQIKEKDVWF